MAGLGEMSSRTPRPGRRAAPTLATWRRCSRPAGSPTVDPPARESSSSTRRHGHRSAPIRGSTHRSCAGSTATGTRSSRPARSDPKGRPTPTYGALRAIPDLELLHADLGPELGGHVGLDRVRALPRHGPGRVDRAAARPVRTPPRHRHHPHERPATRRVRCRCAVPAHAGAQHRPRPRRLQPGLDGPGAALGLGSRRCADRDLDLRRSFADRTRHHGRAGPRGPQCHRRRRVASGGRSGGDPRGAGHRTGRPGAPNDLPAVPREGPGSRSSRPSRACTSHSRTRSC